jgi:small subunit ribosomal protein S5
MSDWIPKTRLGRLVSEGKITTMSDALRTRLPLREPEIVDILLPDMVDEVLDVNMVQRMTDSGRRVRFAITVVVGNYDGFVGLGRLKGKEVGPAIRAAIDVAKLNVIEVKRGCGSWQCGCLTPHSLPFEVIGHSGSVVVSLKPAPRGTGLAVGDIAKSVLRMAGVKDAWGFTKGHTKTTINNSIAAFEALRKTSQLRVTEEQKSRLQIVSGPVQIHVAGAPQDEEPPEMADEPPEGPKEVQ